MCPGVRDLSDGEPPYSEHQSVGDYDIKQMISSQDESIYDLFMNLIPDNIIAATFTTHYTALVALDPHNLTLGYKKVSERAFKPNMLGLCVFSLILGFAVLHLDSKADTIRQLLHETNAIIMNLMMGLIKIMPIGMFCWMCVEAIKMKSPEKVLVQLGWFFGTAIIGHLTIWFILYPVIYVSIVRKNPYKFLVNIIPAVIVAFGSSSSAMTLPVTIQCMEGKNKLSKLVSQFVLPLGMTLNMNGSAMYYPMATLFIVQMHDNILLLFLPNNIFSLIMTMSLPGAPTGGSSVVTFLAYCAIIGVNNPLDILAYIMTMDWLMERLRTMTNIMGDCFLAAIIQKRNITHRISIERDLTMLHLWLGIKCRQTRVEVAQAEAHPDPHCSPPVIKPSFNELIAGNSNDKRAENTKKTSGVTNYKKYEPAVIPRGEPVLSRQRRPPATTNDVPKPILPP
ncbi:unnamed protein product [Medioppia subpectinata]|uniref:Amino acid transporter n=1 Tax=Medioppia subpectinata TaxID=1979941 RepID=A0A7R9KIL7_9ACAR|nr:unnamed protein product [Medioppia subpectinata]CAG2103089.1 unnamed protein product [Medioppia subpectinata]